MNNDKPVPPKPEKPSPHECCGSGCVPCIYDYYYDALEEWNKKYGNQIDNKERNKSINRSQV